MKDKDNNTLVDKLAMTNSLYYLWLEHNNRAFTEKKQLSSSIIRHKIQEMHGSSTYPKLNV